jgi:hypothetical protein
VTVKPLVTDGTSFIYLRCALTFGRRVFKYANKGYGIRILPSYLSYLATYRTTHQTAAIARGECLLAAPLSPEDIAAKSRQWTKECMQNYHKVNYGSSPFHWPRRHNPIKTRSGKPVFSHAMLESYAQVTAEPLGRSCLTGLSLFMRHVALWEAEVRGEIV